MSSNLIGATNYMIHFLLQHMYLGMFLFGFGLITGAMIVTVTLALIRDWIYRRKEAAAMARQLEEITWKQRDGKSILIKDMSDSHLVNAIKMIARTSAARHRSPKVKEILYENRHFKPLVQEAKKRKMMVNILDTPTIKDEQREYIDVILPRPGHKISAGFFPTDWDSRYQE